MSLSKHSAAYPASMHEAVHRALDLGSLTIPTLSPKSLQFKFNGLRMALRLEGKARQIEQLSFLIRGDSLVLQARDVSNDIADLETALAASGKSPDLPAGPQAGDIEESLARILNGNRPG